MNMHGMGKIRALLVIVVGWMGSMFGADKQPETTLAVTVRGGQHESPKDENEGGEKKQFSSKLLIGSRDVLAEIVVRAANDPIIEVSTVGVGNTQLWKTKRGEEPSNRNPKQQVTLQTTIDEVDIDAYVQRTEGAVKRGGGRGGLGGKVDNGFDFDSIIDRFRFILEPICNANGTHGTSPYNPSGIVAGEIATFVCTRGTSRDRAQDRESLKDCEFEWYAATNNIEIVSDPKQEEIGVVAKPDGSGRFELRVRIKGYTGPEPTITGRVFRDWKVIPLHIVIVCKGDSDGPKLLPEKFHNNDKVIDEIQGMIDNANSVFAQAGIHFSWGLYPESLGYWENRIYFLNDNAHYDITDGSGNANPRRGNVNTAVRDRNARELTATLSGLGGFEVYFVNSMVGAAGISYRRTGNPRTKGIIIDSSSANELTLAHELGHALGLEDIKTCDQIERAPLPGIKEAWCPSDWGKGFYRKASGYHGKLIRRLLMHNQPDEASGAGRLDIPLGKVFGQSSQRETRMLNVGLDDIQRDNPEFH